MRCGCICATDRGIHGIITDGGQAVNIIPERTECLFLARAKTSKYAKEIGARVIRCAEAAAMATGTRVEHLVEGGYKNLINNLSMAHRYAAHSETLGTKSREAPENTPTGSTDMGDVSHVMPCDTSVVRDLETRRRQLPRGRVRRARRLEARLRRDDSSGEGDGDDGV